LKKQYQYKYGQGYEFGDGSGMPKEKLVYYLMKGYQPVLLIYQSYKVIKFANFKGL
jgi:hypothetical protein